MEFLFTQLFANNQKSLPDGKLATVSFSASGTPTPSFSTNS